MSIVKLQKQCIDEVNKYYDIADKYYNTRFTRVPVIFSNHMKRMAGKATGYLTGTPVKITFSNTVLAMNKEKFISETVAHEVAHLITLELYKVMNHGKEWDFVMNEVFNKKSNVYHDMAVPGYIYSTVSGYELAVSKIRHEKMKYKKAAYRFKDELITIKNYTGRKVK
jgi:predicted SprT family Zn-dependent metalloprotease